MPFLTIGAIVVDIVSMTEDEPELIGETERAYAGNLRTTNRTIKLNWSAVANEMTDADYYTLKTYIGLGVGVVLDGDATNVSYNVSVRITGCSFVRNGTGFLRVPALKIREI